MTAAEITRKCVRQIAMVGVDAVVELVLPGRANRKMQKRIFPGGPVGRIVSETECNGKQSVIVLFKATEMLIWLQMCELAGVEL